MFGASFLLTSSVSDRSTSGSATSHGGVVPWSHVNVESLRVYRHWLGRMTDGAGGRRMYDIYINGSPFTDWLLVTSLTFTCFDICHV